MKPYWALVLHQAQPPKIPSLLRIQASAAARSSSFSHCFAALSGGHSLATGPLKKKTATHQVEFSTWQVKGFEMCKCKKVRWCHNSTPPWKIRFGPFTFQPGSAVEFLVSKHAVHSCKWFDPSAVGHLISECATLPHALRNRVAPRAETDPFWKAERRHRRTILILSPDQCSPKPNVDSFGSNDKLRQNVSKKPEMINLEFFIRQLIDGTQNRITWCSSIQLHSAFGSVLPLFRFHPSFQRCPLQRWACLSPVILISAVEPLVKVSHLASDPSLENFSPLVLLLVAEHFSLEPVVGEKRTKKLMVRQLRGQQQRSARHGLKLRFLSKSFLLASLLQGDFRVMELGAFERQLSPTVLLPSRSAAQRLCPKPQKRYSKRPSFQSWLFLHPP